MRSAALLASILTVACSGERAGERHELGGLQYVIPDDWQDRDQSEHQTKIIVWSPAPDNKRVLRASFVSA